LTTQSFTLRGMGGGTGQKRKTTLRGTEREEIRTRKREKTKEKIDRYETISELDLSTNRGGSF